MAAGAAAPGNNSGGGDGSIVWATGASRVSNDATVAATEGAGAATTAAVAKALCEAERGGVEHPNVLAYFSQPTIDGGSAAGRTQGDGLSCDLIKP